MILFEHKEHHERLRDLGIFNPSMLMLGNQEDGLDLGKELFGNAYPYKTLDPDGGNFKFDLTSNEVITLFNTFSTVYNLGTLEHIWDVHKAYVNASKMVKLGGHFVGHSPVGGYEGHGVHISDWRFILNFFEINGFEITCNWFSNKEGYEVDQVVRNCGNIILWFAAKRIKVVEFQAPQQVFLNGIKI